MSRFLGARRFWRSASSWETAVDDGGRQFPQHGADDPVPLERGGALVGRRSEQLPDVHAERGGQLLERLGGAMAAVDDVADRVGVQAGESGQFDLGDALFLDQGHDRIAPSRHGRSRFG